MDSTFDETLVEQALSMALTQRKPAAGLLHHSDRGYQYTSEAYQAFLKEHGIQVSMSRRGNCWDNAVVEWFFGTLKRECTSREHFRTHEQAREVLFEFIEVFNNRVRKHSTLGYLSPFAYYDYYQGGTFSQGEARTFFGNQVQLVDDASQGNNSSAPVPGDLLIFQDVNDGAHWTSGEISGDPGHVVVVTSVTSSAVNVVQQNWHNGETHSFTLQHVGNGYHVVDNSGWTGRITRGWIHFSANGGSSNSSVSVQGGPAVA